MTKFLVILALLFVAVPALAQTTVTATITDSDGQTWNNGHGFATFVPGPPNAYKCQSTITSPTNFTMDDSGTFSVSLADNSLCTPVGSQWTFTLCSNTSAPCSNVTAMVFGGTQNLSNLLSAGVKAPRFSATSSVQSFGYSDGEVTPIPVPGGWYFNVTNLISRQWNGAEWQDFGGSSLIPCGSQYEVQVNNGAGALGCDPDFLYNTVTHTLQSTANTQVNAMSSMPRAVYDPMDTMFDGGLAAAIAGTSGYTPTQVINAAADYAYCQTRTNHEPSGWIILPGNGISFNVDGVKLWPQQRIGGESYANIPLLAHPDSPTAPMISFHSSTDTITCNGTVYTPGAAVAGEIAYIGISGAFTGANDIGILANTYSGYVHDIIGWGVGFGQQAVWVQGTSTYAHFIGYPSGQLKGCQDYIYGVSTGQCYAVQLDNLDGGADHIYATDAASFLSGRGPGPCYPNCGAIGVDGPNSDVNDLFGQDSDIDIVSNATSVRGVNWRADGTSMEGVRFSAASGNDMIHGVVVLGPCLSTSLSANYGAGTPTGCYGVYSANQSGGGNVVSAISAGPSEGIFGPSYIQCAVDDGANSEAGAPNTWGPIDYLGNPSNATANDLGPCGGNQLTASPRWIFPAASTPVFASTSTVNISGITSLYLTNGLTVTNFTNGVAGQRVLISAAPGETSATIAVTGNFLSCSGLPVTITNDTQIDAVFNPYDGELEMVCNPPNPTPWHVNYYGNTAPTSQSLLDVIGNVQAHQVGAFTTSAAQLYGPTLSTQACFEQVLTYPDGSHVVSNLACTYVNLATMTSGEIFANLAPQATTDLYLVSNAQGNGVALGKFPAHSTIGTPDWNYTVIAAGGDGSAAPPANDNDTGSSWEVFDKATCPSSLPTCSSEYEGVWCMVPHAGSAATVRQWCNYNGSTWQWSTF